MEDDKTNSLKNLFQYLLFAEILSEQKIYITTFSKKFPNQCKKQTNNKVLSNLHIQGLILNMVVKSM